MPHFNFALGPTNYYKLYNWSFVYAAILGKMAQRNVAGGLLINIITHKCASSSSACDAWS